MKHSQATSPHPLLIALAGSVATAVVTVVLAEALEKHDIPLASLLIGSLAGLTVGAILWIATVRANQWQERRDYQERQRRDDANKLKSLQQDIYFAGLNLRQSLLHDESVLQALNSTNDLDSELLQLSKTLPNLEPDFDTYSVAEEWESFLDKLYPYARDGDITGARQLGRFTWRLRLSRWGRLSWRSLSGWCRLRLRRLRSTLKRNRQVSTRQRGRRSGSVRCD